MGERLSTTLRMTAENQRAAGTPFSNGLKSPNLNLISCPAPRLPRNSTRSRKRRLGMLSEERRSPPLAPEQSSREVRLVDRH